MQSMVNAVICPDLQQPAAPDQSRLTRVRNAYWRERLSITWSWEGDVQIEPGHIARYDGGQDSNGVNFKGVWPKILQRLSRHGCQDIEGYIHAQFLDKNIRQPNTFYNDKAWKRYEEFQRAAEEIFTNMAESDGAELVRAYRKSKVWAPQASDEMRWTVVLEDPDLQVTVLARYCSARFHALHTTAEKLFPRAVQQTLRCPLAYEEYWKEFLPPGFITDVWNHSAQELSL
jgi:hypothetical protein